MPMSENENGAEGRALDELAALDGSSELAGESMFRVERKRIGKADGTLGPLCLVPLFQPSKLDDDREQAYSGLRKLHVCADGVLVLEEPYARFYECGEELTFKEVVRRDMRGAEVIVSSLKSVLEIFGVDVEGRETTETTIPFAGDGVDDE